MKKTFGPFAVIAAYLAVVTAASLAAGKITEYVLDKVATAMAHFLERH